mgnify:CR=1 FL=1
MKIALKLSMPLYRNIGKGYISKRIAAKRKTVIRLHELVQH